MSTFPTLLALILLFLTPAYAYAYAHAQFMGRTVTVIGEQAGNALRTGDGGMIEVQLPAGASFDG
jgi:hypothetical protein